VLEPGEVGAIEIHLDASRFVGAKTRLLYLTLDNGKPFEVILTVKAVAEVPAP
jgi:hypothetical protein